MGEQRELVYLLAEHSGRTTEEENDKAVATAVGHIAGAVATAYLGPAAGALIDEAVTAIAGALLSADDDRFEKEIISRLDRIEAKLDTIIYFLNVQLREIVDDALDQNEIKKLVSSISVNAIKMRTAMRTFEAATPPTDIDAQTLVSAAETILGNGYELFKRSRDRFTLGVPYFAVALSALNLARGYNRKYDATIGIWAREYLKQIQPWLTQGLPSGNSFEEIRARILKEISQAQALMKDFVVGSPVVYLNLVSEIYAPGTPMASAAGITYGPDEFQGTIGYAAQYVWNADSTVTVTDLKAYRVVKQRVSPGDDLAAVFGVPVHPSFPPMFGPAGLRNDPGYWNFYSSIYAAFQVAAISLRDAPPRVEVLDFVIKVLSPFSAGLQELAVLGKNPLVPVVTQAA